MAKLSEEDQQLIDRDIEEMVARATNPAIKPKLVIETKEAPKPVAPGDFKFDEDKLIKELFLYVKSTYGEHYSGKYQATDMIIDSGHGTGFCVGSIMKYAKRYGKKEGHNRKDILKILHYALILLHVHDQENNDA